MGVRLSFLANFDTADTVGLTTNATELSQLSARLAIEPHGEYSLEALPMSLSKSIGKHLLFNNKLNLDKMLIN